MEFGISNTLKQEIEIFGNQNSPDLFSINFKNPLKM